MTREEIVNLFINDTLTGDVTEERIAILGYEAFKERKSIETNGNFLLCDALYKEYARGFKNYVVVLCLIRQYEAYLATLQLTALN